MSIFPKSYPWQIRSALDNARAMAPFQRTLRQLQDRAFPYKRQPAIDRDTLRWGLTMLEWLGDLDGITVLEIGTGWQPLIPVLFSLAGATVYTADLNHLLRLDSLCATLESIRENQDEIIRRVTKITPDGVAYATRECRDLEQRLKELRITYDAPCDCRHLILNSGSIDLVTSRSVLEHVPPPIIADIFSEARRLLRPGGRMMHIVDNSDHWAHRDRTITAVNFLQYPDWMFRLTCINSLNYTNRLRHSEYLSLLETAGFKLQRVQGMIDPNCVAALTAMRLAERFRGFEAEDLATTTTVVLAEVPPVALPSTTVAPASPPPAASAETVQTTVAVA
jgi:SAM-dependent methyltransferase